MHIHEDTTPAREDRLTTVVCFKYEIFKLAVITTYSLAFRGRFPGGGGRGEKGVTPYHGLYEEAPPERGTFFWLQVYERAGILLVEVYKMVGKSLISVCKKALKVN